MFNVFYVNDGYMLVLDLPLVGCFRDLHQELTYKTGVQPRDQVLFLSNGEALVGDYLLSDYSDAGTENNPIYFVKRITTEGDVLNSREEEGITSLYGKWKQSLDDLDTSSVKPSLINKYFEIGGRAIEVAETLMRYCKKVVVEHQHINYGWTAVIRNLDENSFRIGRKNDRLNKICENIPLLKANAQLWISNFDVVMDVLSKIKIPHSLIARKIHSSDEESHYDSPPEHITLLEWIEKQDPLHTLDSLIEHVEQYIHRLTDTEMVTASGYIKLVFETMNRDDYRDIRGIDKRLGTLEIKLNDLQIKSIKLKDGVNKFLQWQFKQTSFHDVIAEQRRRAQEIHSSLYELSQHACLFLNSKLELLTNVRQRLVGMVRQNYDRLQLAQTNLVLFEQKFNILRRRLDLVKKIREAPILFVACVAEVIRRQAFRQEFNEWLALFSQKCSEFIREENVTRAQLSYKLDKHFLRDIFQGLGDELPDFCPSKVNFDKKLPTVSYSLLRDLRESLKDHAEMENMFTVVSPQVFSRLEICAKSAQQSEAREPQMPLHREESFFVREKPANPICSNFNSSNWLNVIDENSEMSPVSNQFFMSKTVGSTASLNVESNVTTPSDLVPNLESIQPLNSLPRVMCSRSSVDLASPTSIHPDHFKQRTKTSIKAKTSSSSDADRSCTERPTFHAGDDSEVFLNADVLETSNSSTPYITPILSPKRMEESSQASELQDSQEMIFRTEVLKKLLSQLAEINKELNTLQSEAIVYKNDVEQLAEQNMRSISDQFTKKIKATQASLDQQTKCAWKTVFTKFASKHYLV